MNIRNRVLATAGAVALLASASFGAIAALPGETADVDVAITPVNDATVTVGIIETTAFGDKPYSLSSQTTTGVLSVRTIDNRGTAVGWKVSISATDFKRTVHTTVGADIPVGNLALSAGTVTSAPGSGPAPTSVTVPPTMPGSSAQLWEATTNEGAGDYTLPLNGTLTLPAGALVDTYESTVTVSVVAGP